MGVSQLLLGILLIGSIWGSKGNTTLSKNVTLDKIDSTLNVIEKLPKTDTQINLVNKDDSHKNDSNEYESSEKDEKGRNDNSRSIDLEKFDTHDFQNNDYGTSDRKKYLENSIRRPSTKLYSDFSTFTLTTPESIFDSKLEEAKQIIDQEEYEPHTPDHLYDHNIDEDDHLDRLFGETKNKPNSTLKYKEKTKISKNNTVSDGSEYNELTVERTHNINFDSVVNFTSSDEEDSENPENTPPKVRLETTSPKSYVATTRKTIILTKPPTDENAHILSNKIETETIKPVNSLTTEYSTGKVTKGDNEIVPKEQIYEENKIVPAETIITHEKTDEANGTEQTSTTTTTVTNKKENKVDQVETTTIIDTANTTEQINDTTEQTKITNSETTEVPTTTTEVPTTTTEVPTTTTEANTSKTETETTTEQSISTRDATTTTYVDSTTATFPLDLRIETTDVPTTESTTFITTTDEAKETTTVSHEENTENRISKAFAFESTLSLKSETTEATTETIRIKLSTPTEGTTTFNVINTETVPETTSTTIKEQGIDTTTVIIDHETTTLAPTTTPEVRTTMETTTEMITTAEVVHSTKNSGSKANLSLPASTSGTSPITTVVPTFRNLSDSTEETIEHVTTTSSTEDSSESTPGTDAGTLGSGENKGKIAAIVISTVGAVCLILLAGLLYIMRKRQKRFNYKQRCRPVGLDDYSVDNVSGYNSTRRKAERQSKRSYGNPAFDDPVAVTHPLNFTALAKFASDTDDIKAEFLEIPQIITKTNELPEGCETKNRYANVIPLPETRVFLQPIDGYPNSDYINANFVTGPKNTENYYIACQAPMQNTVDDFWRMVWEQQTKVILMLTHLFENGVEKCVDYLPPSEVLDCNRLFGDFQVTLKKRDVKEKYIISNLQLKNMVSNSWREVTHFWYLGWPEKGVPSEENSIIAFLIEARSYMKSSTLDKNAALNGNFGGSSKTEINPVVVHCSPGTGRTGVAIACDIAIREFEKTRLVDIPKIVYRIRRDRASAVQTKEQYMFIYKVVSLYATKLTGGALDSF